MTTLLTTPHETVKVLRDAMRRYKQFRWSIAWASWGFPLCEELLKKRKRIVQLVVGTHFYQTHPEFLERFIDDPTVHVIWQSSSGVFHPKIYCFENTRDDWECVIGSPNFTKAAFSENVEIAAHFDSASAGATGTYDVLRAVIDEHWKNGKPVTKELLDPYSAIWKRKRQLLDQLAGTYGGKGGKPIVSVEVLKLSWSKFVDTVKSEKAHALSHRIDVLSAVRTYFQDKKHLSACGKQERRRIAGLAGQDQGIDWGYFGSMKVAGRLWKPIDTNDAQLSAALDAIPSDGLVTQNDYQAFVREIQNGSPEC